MQTAKDSGPIDGWLAFCLCEDVQGIIGYKIRRRRRDVEVVEYATLALQVGFAKIGTSA